MRRQTCHLAMETTGRAGSIALGCDGALLGVAQLPPPQRHRVELMPAIDALCRQHGVRPADLAAVGLSIGPGSFTGLRIAVATVKMLAATTPAKVFAYATADVIAAETPVNGAAALAVLLSVKHEAAWCSLYRNDGKRWALEQPPVLAPIDRFLVDAPSPLLVIAGVELPGATPAGVTVLPVDCAEPSARTVLKLMQEQPASPVDPLALLPLYARAPEAQEQWDRRYGASATIQNRTPAQS